MNKIIAYKSLNESKESFLNRCKSISETLSCEVQPDGEIWMYDCGKQVIVLTSEYFNKN